MNKIFKFTVFFLFVVFGFVFAMGGRQADLDSALHQPDDLELLSEYALIAENPPVLEDTPETDNTQVVEDAAVPTRGEQVMRALAEAYPKQIDKIEFRNDDWAVLLRDIWFYYAEGRLLPEYQLENIMEYSRHSFYNYPEELPPWVHPTPEQIERFRQWETTRTQNPTRRYPLFYDTLWRIQDRTEAGQRQQTFRFLGQTIYMHYLVIENLSLVEEHILAASRTDANVKAWIDNLDKMHAWNWRNISETQSRSNHSYGLAIDLLPRALRNRQTYWIWTRNSGVDWWTVDYSKRYHPPDAVIKAFEKFGFIWGGKWMQYDTMHFEYRPEILILNGMYPETRR